MNNQQYLGDFKVTDKLIITDPCYEVETALSGDGGLVVNAQKGTWVMFVDYVDNAVAKLFVASNKWYNSYKVKNVTQTHDGYGFAAVDSGQVSIFNLDYYKANQPDDNYFDTNSFYRKVCDISLSEDLAGICFDQGCVSSSGYGDGEYAINVGIDNDEIVQFIEVVFIDDEDEDEYEDDDY